MPGRGRTQLLSGTPSYCRAASSRSDSLRFWLPLIEWSEMLADAGARLKQVIRGRLIRALPGCDCFTPFLRTSQQR